MTNEPYNDRLRQEYTKLGFIDGERLSLDDPESLAKALIAIRVRYRAFGLDLAAPPP